MKPIHVSRLFKGLSIKPFQNNACQFYQKSVLSILSQLADEMAVYYYTILYYIVRKGYYLLYSKLFLSKYTILE